jgi:hypothetical protein
VLGRRLAAVISSRIGHQRVHRPLRDRASVATFWARGAYVGEAGRPAGRLRAAKGKRRTVDLSLPSLRPARSA